MFIHSLLCSESNTDFQLLEGRKLTLIKGRSAKEVDERFMNDAGSQVLSHAPDLADGDKARLISNAISRSFVEAQRFQESAGGSVISTGLYQLSFRDSAEAIIDAILTYRYPTDTSILNNIQIFTVDQPTQTCFAQMMTEKQTAMKAKKTKKTTTPSPRRIETRMYLNIC